MDMTIAAAQKIVRSLVAAEGYLELDLPARALAELEKIDDVQACGELLPYVQFLSGEAHKLLAQYPAAIDYLHEAARSIPSPYCGPVWQSLGECFRKDGQDVLADVAEMFAEDAREDAALQQNDDADDSLGMPGETLDLDTALRGFRSADELTAAEVAQADAADFSGEADRESEAAFETEDHEEWQAYVEAFHGRVTPFSRNRAKK